MNDAERLEAHAAQWSLTDRLRGRAFIPGVHYVTQAEAWMEEAADEIERLRLLCLWHVDSPSESGEP